MDAPGVTLHAGHGPGSYTRAHRGNYLRWHTSQFTMKSNPAIGCHARVSFQDQQSDIALRDSREWLLERPPRRPVHE